jgi:hypothetical protein
MIISMTVADLYISLTTDGGASAQHGLIQLFMRHLFIERTVNGW